MGEPIAVKAREAVELPAEDLGVEGLGLVRVGCGDVEMDDSRHESSMGWLRGGGLIESAEVKDREP